MHTHTLSLCKLVADWSQGVQKAVRFLGGNLSKEISNPRLPLLGLAVLTMSLLYGGGILILLWSIPKCTKVHYGYTTTVYLSFQSFLLRGGLIPPYLNDFGTLHQNIGFLKNPELLVTKRSCV